jgi:hypothetical protein
MLKSDWLSGAATLYLKYDNGLTEAKFPPNALTNHPAREVNSGMISRTSSSPDSADDGNTM